MTSIDRLTGLCPPPPTAPSTDWSSTGRALGMPLPTDCKQIADTYGPGAFCGFLHLCHPHAPTQWTSLTGPAWARANGYDVPDRGRIPVAILEAWEKAGNG